MDELHHEDERLDRVLQEEKRFYESLEKTQWLGLNELGHYQQMRAGELVRHALAEVPFYRRRLAFLESTGGEPDLRRWLEIPFLTRDELAEHQDDLKARRYPRSHGHLTNTRSSSTSGGRQITMFKTVLDTALSGCASIRQNRAFGIDWSLPLVAARSLDPSLRRGYRPEEGEVQRWGPRWMAPEKRGERHGISVHMRPDEQLAYCASLGPVYFNSSPSNTLRLTDEAERNPVDGLDLRGIITVGERVSEDLRERVRTIFGCPLMDSFSSSESGLIALQCPSGEGYHLQMELAVIEVVDDDGAPCRPGQTGRVVTTPLYNYSMPLIRYLSDDYVTVGGACSCGRSLPLFSKVLGRRGNLLRSPSGQLLPLEVSSAEMSRMTGGRRWRLVQKGLKRFELQLMDLGQEDGVDEAAIAGYLTALLGWELDISSKNVPALGLTSGGKFNSFISEL